MAALKTVILLIVIAGFDVILTVKVREREENEHPRRIKVKEREKRESNEYDLKSIFNYLQSQDSKEKKDKTSIFEVEEPRHIKVKERENGETRFVKVKERENEDHRVQEREKNQRRMKENGFQVRRTKEENEAESKTLNRKAHRERGFAKIAPTVGVYATPKITTIKKWKYNNKSREEEVDVSRSFADYDRVDKKSAPKIKERKHRSKDKRRRTNERKSRELRYGEKKNNFNNDLVISKEINMTKSFKSDQPVDIIVHIKMKN